MLLWFSDYVISVVYDEILAEIFQIIAEHNSCRISDLIGKHSRKNSRGKLFNSERDQRKGFGDRNDIYSPNDRDRGSGRKLANALLSKFSESKIENIIIKSMFYMKMLLKITSKKFNSNILSFYFKIPERHVDELADDNYLKRLLSSNINQFSSFYHSLHVDKSKDGQINKKVIIIIIF